MKRFLSHLNEIEIKEVAEKKVDSLEKLIILLLKRVHPQNVEMLASILKQALIPSISVEVDDEIEKLFVEIEKNPNLLFNKAIQIHIEKLILKRFEKDKLVVVQKTSDISKLVLMMEEYFNEAISSNGSGTKNILNIREKLESYTGFADPNNLCPKNRSLNSFFRWECLNCDFGPKFKPWHIQDINKNSASAKISN